MAMCGWQFSTFVIGLRLRENFSRRRVDSEMKSQESTQPRFESAKTKELLKEADLGNVVPISITENTTRHLSEKANNKSAHSEH